MIQKCLICIIQNLFSYSEVKKEEEHEEITHETEKLAEGQVPPPWELEKMNEEERKAFYKKMMNEEDTEEEMVEDGDFDETEGEEGIELPIEEEEDAGGRVEEGTEKEVEGSVEEKEEAMMKNEAKPTEKVKEVNAEEEEEEDGKEDVYEGEGESESESERLGEEWIQEEEGKERKN